MDSLRFQSRRSCVHSRGGMVAASQVPAAEAGADILRRGGNAVDAAIATAAALCVTEPCSTGLGGDFFMLYYSATDRRVHAVNASGRAPAEATRDRVLQDVSASAESIPRFHGHAVTVPGAVAGWVDSLERFGSGRLALAEILGSGERLAEDGFAVSKVTAYHWGRGLDALSWGRTDAHAGHELLTGTDGRPPKHGEVFRNPGMARCLREIGAGGKEAFYQGSIAESIVRVVQDHGGTLSMQDMAEHTTTFPEAVSTAYNGVRLHEVPPNGQGLTALIALNILSQLKEAAEAGDSSCPWALGSVDYFHHLIEAMRLAFADARAYIADPEHAPVPVEELLSPEYAKGRAALVEVGCATADVQSGSPLTSSCTVSFQVVDAEGNAVAAVQSLYQGFGTGLVPAGCGFTLQNRGSNFSLEEGHPNCIAPGKRPFHTIIPAMATVVNTDGDGEELYATYSNMGGFMQPQGHVQLLSAMVDFGLDPQEAVDLPRFCIADGTANGAVFFEEGIDPEVVAELRRRGHAIAHADQDAIRGGHDRALFGRAQIIRRDERQIVGGGGSAENTTATTRVWVGGSDGRADGCAMAV